MDDDERAGIVFLGVLCALLAVWLSPHVLARVAPFLRPAPRPVAPVRSPWTRAAQEAAQAATAEAKRLAKLEADAANQEAVVATAEAKRLAKLEADAASAMAEEQDRARAAMAATAAKYDALVAAARASRASREQVQSLRRMKIARRSSSGG